MSRVQLSSRLRPGTSALTFAACGLIIAACGSSTPGASPSGTGAGTNQITITATSRGYSVSGALRPGTATITFADRARVTHQMNAIRLKPGVTRAQVLAALEKGGDPDVDVAPLVAAPPGPANDYGSPGMAGPGQSITVTMLGLPAGTYVFADFLAGNDGRPYFTKGFIGEFQVKGSSDHSTPSIRGSIGLGDSAISFPSHFDGVGTYKVTNDGNHENSLAIARLDGGTSLVGYFQYVATRLNHQSIDGGGGVIAGSTTDFRPGQSAYITFHLTPGTYAYIEPPHGPLAGPPPSGTVVVK